MNEVYEYKRLHPCVHPVLTSASMDVDTAVFWNKNKVPTKDRLKAVKNTGKVYTKGSYNHNLSKKGLFSVRIGRMSNLFKFHYNFFP